MTTKEIKRKAAGRLIENPGSVLTVTTFLYSLVVFFLLCEVLIFLGLRELGYVGFYDPRALFSDGNTQRFWTIKVLVMFAIMTPIFAIVRRMMLNISKGMPEADMRRYISAHLWKYYFRSLRNAIVLNFLRAFTMVPGAIGIYGVYHWFNVLRVGELTSMGLFCLTASISLSCVWAILWVKYLVSLSLTPLIMALNPRSNIFDACDLSVKLMDGKHWRYLTFLCSFIVLIPALLLIYPMLIAFPYFTCAKMIFQLDVLGERGSDKLPGMIKRWKKYESQKSIGS